MPAPLKSFPAVLLLLYAILGLSLTPAAHGQLSVLPVASGFTNPILVIAPPGDFTRIFVVQQDGVIEIVENGAILSPPFLDIRSLVSFGGEQGLLGMAFHPAYASNGFFSFTIRA